MAKRADFTDEIAANVRGTRHVCWWKKIAPQHVETLAAIREAYDAGKFGRYRKPAAEAIADYLTRHGIASVKYQEIQKWLVARV